MAVLFLVIAPRAEANPVFGEAREVIQPDGSLVDVRIWGDEYYGITESLDGYSLVRDPITHFLCYARLSADGRDLLSSGTPVGAAQPGDLGLAQHIRIDPASASTKAREAREHAAQEGVRVGGPRGGSGPRAPSTGLVIGICLIVDFADDVATIPRSTVQNFCNQQGFTGYGNSGSVYDYYYDVSEHQLEYVNLVPVYHRAAHNKTYYTDPAQDYGTRARELIIEALDAADATLDFSLMDADEDGYIDAVNLFYAGGCPNNWAEGLWPHSGWISYSNDGVETERYQITDMGTSLTLQTFCHENGHMLFGWPDLYDYGYDSKGDGRYCLMAFGTSATNPCEPCAYLKYTAGWAVTTTLAAPQTGLALPVSSTNYCYKFNNSGNANEYYLIENRQQSGRDSGLPDNGLAIWHIDTAGSNENQQMTPASHYLVTLVQADGDWDLENNNNYGDSTDLWAGPTYKRCTPCTSPDTDWWNGTASGLHIRDISTSSQWMTFSFGPDTTGATPNPMTFAAAPSPVSTSAITMTATTAIDVSSSPVSYFFDFVSGGAGGTDSAWQSSTVYADNGLLPNTIYNYRVQSRDSACTPNPSGYSVVANTATKIETPTGVTYVASTNSTTSITLYATGTLSNLTGGASGVYFDSTTSGGDGGINAWVHSSNGVATGLTPNTTYAFRAKARNHYSVETGYSATSNATTSIESPTGVSNGNVTTTSMSLYADGGPFSNLTAESSGLYFDSTTAGGDTGLNTWVQATPVTVTGLTPNTTYQFRVKARNRVGDETPWSATVGLTTLANVPAAPLLSVPQGHSMKVDVSPNGNPSWTEFAIKCTATSPNHAAWVNQYVSATGSHTATAVWQTDGVWGIKSITALNENTTYTFAVKARNAAGVETTFGPGASLNTGNDVTLGACCWWNDVGHCTREEEEDCAQMGDFQGAGTDCSPNPCVPVQAGACCNASGTCSMNTQAACGSAGGTYLGDDSDCTPNLCAQPTGACCTLSTCSVTTNTACTAGGGVYEGDGSACGGAMCQSVITFTDINAGLTGVVSSALAWGDYDNDGDLDLVVTGFAPGAGRICRIYRNNGNGTFSDINAGLIGVTQPSLGWGDYDNDGDLDLALAGTYDSYIDDETGEEFSFDTSLIYRNNGDSTFTDIGAGLDQFSLCGLAWGDYDNDGYLDLALTGSGRSKIYRNNANGTFSDIGAALSGLSFSSLAWGDYDNDGDVDLALAGNAGTGQTKIYRNDGNGTFTDIAAGLTGVSLCSLAWGDYDNDGYLDLAACGSQGGASNVSKIYRNNGNGTFTDIGAGLTGVKGSSLAWGDYDNDGNLDLALAGFTGTTRVTKTYRNNGNSTFSEIVTGLPGVENCAVSWGDFDSDGRLELALAGWAGSSTYICRIYHTIGGPSNTPPSAPANLTITQTGADATFSWDAASDAQTPAGGLSYNLRVGTAPGDDNMFCGMADSSSGLRRLPAIGNAQKRFSWTLHGITSEIYGSVQAIDTALAGGPWSTEVTTVVDSDGDGVPDSTDNCPTAFNPGQEDVNQNAIGDACELTACCLPDGSCLSLITTECAAIGGLLQPLGTPCTPNPCPQPTGACCAASGVCAIDTLAGCTATSGTYQGDGSSCQPNPCPQPTGACCSVPGGACSLTTQSDCSGTWQGPGTTCAPGNCQLILGDMNCDASLTIEDVSLFAKALCGLSDPAICDVSLADMNLDGDANGIDVPYFVDALVPQ